MYLHIYYHLKTSNDLEIYEIDQPSKDRLEEICDIRQPVIFNYIQGQEIIDKCNLINVMEQYGAFDIQLLNLEKRDNTNELYLPFILNETVELFKNDVQGKYLTENNEDFLKETGLIKNYKHNDKFLRPQMVSKCKYDLISGSTNTKTPLRYEMNYRNYYLVTQGEITIKLIPPQYTKYLYAEKNYLNFEFSSPIDVWNIETQPKYKNNFDKVKSLEVNVKEGQIIYIPAYWWFSINFNKISSISCFYYRTYMNTMAITPHLFIHLLQKMNVKHEIVEKQSNENIEKKEN